MTTSPPPTPWWDLLINDSIAEGIISAGLTPAYLAGAYARLFEHTDKTTLLSTVLTRLLQDPPGPTIPYFYPCGGDTKRVIVKPVSALYASRMRMGVRYPSDRSVPARAIIDDDLWEPAGASIGGLTAALLAQYDPPVQAETYSRDSKGKWQRFKSKDKWAIGRVRDALAASQHPPTNSPPDSTKT